MKRKGDKTKDAEEKEEAGHLTIDYKGGKLTIDYKGGELIMKEKN